MLYNSLCLEDYLGSISVDLHTGPRSAGGEDELLPFEGRENFRVEERVVGLIVGLVLRVVVRRWVSSSACRKSPPPRSLRRRSSKRRRRQRMKRWCLRREEMSGGGGDRSGFASRSSRDTASSACRKPPAAMWLRSRSMVVDEGRGSSRKAEECRGAVGKGRVLCV